MGGLDWAADQQ
ncbi:hypothetical protein A2U01_0093277, partial [Trifolium medium]|nr:hypothetical protein [Trifolium medium]